MIAVAALVVTGGGVSTATWLLEGSGPGATEGATIQPLVVLAGTPTGGLYPEPNGGYPTGQAVGTVTSLVSNPNPFPVRLTSASIGNISLTPVSGRTCANSNVVAASATIALPSSPAIIVGPGAAPVTVQVPAAVRMLPTADIGCQGVQVSAMLTFSGLPA